MHRRFLFGALCGLVLCIGARPASAQNLLANPNFELALGLSGWSDFGSALPADGTRAWATPDAGGSPTSGSARLAVLGTSAADAVVGLAQCVAVTPGVTYAFSTRLRTPLGQNAGEARLVQEVSFFSDGACGVPLHLADGQGAVVGAAYPLDDTLWRGIPGAAPGVEVTVLAPGGAARAQVRLYLERISGTSPVEANVDAAGFHDASTVPVGLTSFTAE